jgi:acetyltransferase
MLGAMAHSWLLKDILRRWGSIGAHHQGYPESYPHELVGRVSTKEGRELLVRPVRPDDVPLFKDGFSRLSRETVYRRFHGHVRSLSEEAYHYLTHIDYQTHLALIVIDEVNEAGVGVARYYLPEGSELAEAAIVVVDDWQGRGVGKLLLARLVEAAKARGVSGFEAFVQSDNVRMRRMIERSGYRLHSEEEDEDGVVRVWLRFDEEASP